VKLKIITKDISELEKAWGELFETSEHHNPFLSWEWCNIWWKHFGTNRRLMVLAIERDGQIVSLAPLMVEQSKTFRRPVVRFIGSNLADYSDFLVGREETESAKLFWDYLGGMNNGTKITLSRFVEDSPSFLFLRNPSNRDKKIVVEAVNTSPYVKITGGWDEFYKNINKSIKKDLNWCTNKLAKAGSVSFDRKSAIDSKTIEQMFAIQIKRQQYKPRKSQFEDNSVRNFFAEVADSFSKKGWLDFASLSLDEKIIAYVFGFRLNGTVFYWNVSFDPDYQQFSPGKSLLKFLLEDSFKKGDRIFDFMIGDESYKSHWATGKKECFAVTMYPNKTSRYIEQTVNRTRNYLKEKRLKYKSLNRVWIKISKYL